MALGDLEREVMTQLWAATAGSLTVRQVHERLSGHRELAYTTVMTVLDRLAKKGVVTREKADRAYLYAAAQTREEMTAAVMLDALSDSGDRDAALAHFLGRLPPEALTAAIRAAAEQAPDAKAPDAKAPVTKAPDAKAPDTKAPASKAARPGSAERK